MKRWLSLICFALAALVLLGTAAGEQAAVPDITNIKQQPIPENEAMAFMKALGAGWNLGNTFEATKGDWNRNADEMTLETAWQKDVIQEPLFDFLKEAGIRTVRMPVSWHDHVAADGTISERWLSRVQQVVDWAMSKGLYVILNAHHDVDKKWYYPSEEYYANTEAYMKSIWTQLSERFKDYDDHLIFEPINEPRQVGTDHEWGFSAGNPGCLEAADCINRLNQLFVDIVRQSGGHNADRYLMIPGYAHAVAPVLDDSFVLPTDSADNRLIVTVHTYTPYDFALDIHSPVKSFDLQEQGKIQPIAQAMASLYKKYVVNGIPVVVGEFGCVNKNNLQDRVNYTAYAAVAAACRNIPVVWWDNNNYSGSGETFCIVDRKNYTARVPEILEALLRYGSYDNVAPRE